MENTMLHNSYDRFRGQADSTEINVSPLIDMVFILLIFFIVTTSFVKETGVDVEKAQASTSQELPKQSIMIGITSNGEVFIGGEKLSLLGVRSAVRDALIGDPEKPVIIIADRNSRNAALVDVMDECRIAGAKNINLASEEE